MVTRRTSFPPPKKKKQKKNKEKKRTKNNEKRKEEIKKKKKQEIKKLNTCDMLVRKPKLAYQDFKDFTFVTVRPAKQST